MASHHFLVYADLDVQVPKASRQQPAPRRDLRALRLPGASNRFAAAFADRAKELESSMPVSTASDIDALMKESFFYGRDGGPCLDGDAAEAMGL